MGLSSSCPQCPQYTDTTEGYDARNYPLPDANAYDVTVTFKKTGGGGATTFMRSARSTVSIGQIASGLPAVPSPPSGIVTVWDTYGHKGVAVIDEHPDLLTIPIGSLYQYSYAHGQKHSYTKGGAKGVPLRIVKVNVQYR